jgi:hypothetical protein
MLRDERVNVVWLQKELAGDWSEELKVFMKRLSNEAGDSAAV